MNVGDKVYILSDKEYGRIGFIGILGDKRIYRVDTKEYKAWFYEDELVVVKQ